MLAVPVLTDAEIQALLVERKVLPNGFKLKQRKSKKIHHDEHEAVIKGTDHEFKIITRRSRLNPLDFSVILCTMINNKEFRLKRYNGNSNPHRNFIEKTALKGFHVHTATERYQLAGVEEDWFAVACSGYSDCKGAFELMKRENNFETRLAGGQRTVFDFT
jgi:hypothetical protein